MYQVKVYARRNAIMVTESPVISSWTEADKYLSSVGHGEGYWAELVQLYPSYSVTLSSTV